MDRLTFDGNFCDIAMCRENPCPHNGSCSQKETWERLKAYEDTGLTPEQIRNGNATVMAAYEICAKHSPETIIRRLKEILIAEAEGRLVVLPCKVVCGMDIWWADSEIHTEPIKCEICSFAIYSGFDAKPQIWMNCYLYEAGISRSFRITSIGKTVFLTRAEAEAALKGGAE